MSVKLLEFGTTQEAWEGINEYLFLEEKEIKQRGGSFHGTQVLTYDIILRSRKAWVDPEFDFSKVLGYSIQKWSSLVNNYINFEYLDILKGQILTREKKGNNNYNESMLFDNSHNSGKGCLLSLTFSRRVSDLNPVLIFCLRSSEVTKRLLFDLLLIQRIGEYVYGKDQEFGIQLYCPNVYLDVAAFCMYDNHKELDTLTKDKDKKNGKVPKKVKHLFKKFLETDPSTVKYRSHLRVVEQLQKDEEGWPTARNKKSLKAKELDFFSFDIDVPEEIKAPKEIRSFKRKKKDNKLGKTT
jgi:hypothetical protein